MTLENLPPRNKSQRLIDRKHKQQIEMELQKKNHEHQQRQVINTLSNPQVSDICFGLNELTDSLQALPQDIISYFTLLKEIEAKCVYTVPHLQAYIKRFFTMRKDHPKRSLLLGRIRDCIRDLMPCLEEKMHVATIASDHVKKYVTKLDQAYDIVIDHEIPESIRIGPLWEPCMKVSEPKTVQQQRSESRREALAAKKANKNGNTSAFEDDDGTAAEESSGPVTTNTKKSRGRKEKNSNSSNVSTGTTNGVTTGGKKRKNAASAAVEDDFGVGNTGTSVNGTGTKKSKTSKVRREAKKEVESKSGITSNSHVGKHGATGGTKTRGGSHRSENSESTHQNNSRTSKREKEIQTNENKENAPNTSYEGEPLYCYCQQVSYGEMVGCDGENCEKEWFHLPCTGLKEPPKGEWYCDDCKAKMGLGH